MWFALPAGTQRNAAGFTAVISLAMLNGVTHLTDAPLAALVFAVIPTMLLPAVAVNVVKKIQIGHTQRFMHRHFFYLAYACHLMVLSLIRLSGISADKPAPAERATTIFPPTTNRGSLMSSKTGQAICAGINIPITHPPGRARSNAIVHSGRYVALNPAEIECFMSLQLDNDRYEYTIRFIELAIQCRQLEGMDHADVCGLRNDVIFYEAMFHLFSETGRTAHQQGTVMQRCREIEEDPGYLPLFSQSLFLTHRREPGADNQNGSAAQSYNI